MRNKPGAKKASFLSGATGEKFLSSLMAIAMGLLFGLVILFVSNPAQALPGFSAILTGATWDGLRSVGQVLYYATPVILTGLSVGFAFKTGLFNIGASGQFTCGAYMAVLIGSQVTGLGGAHWIVALLAATLAGAIWGAIPGLLKAYFNVNEVISSIMMNYIGLYLTNYLVTNTCYDSLKNQSLSVLDTANIPRMGLDRLFDGSDVGGGILIALLAVIAVYLLLQKTSFGFEVKAVGLNRDASRYAGINEKRSILLSMMIAGALAGLGGGLLYLAGSGKHLEVVDVIAEEGFTGMSVALLGQSSPFGVLLAGLFIAYITVGGFYMQLYDFAPEIIDIITAAIIYCSALSLLVRLLLDRVKAKKKLREETDAGMTGAGLTPPGVQTTPPDPAAKPEGGEEK